MQVIFQGRYRLELLNQFKCINEINSINILFLVDESLNKTCYMYNISRKFYDTNTKLKKIIIEIKNAEA